jgi:four helix bundle protein
LVAQMRRAAISIPSNIAEGQARHTRGGVRPIHLARGGSVAELETQLSLALDFGFCGEPGSAQAFELLDELRRMLNSLKRKLMAGVQ